MKNKALCITFGDNGYSLEGYEVFHLSPKEEAEPEVVSDGSWLPMIEDSFLDLIIAENVLQHFPYRKITEVLKEWRRALKPEGRVDIAVPDLEDALKAVNLHPSARALERIYGEQKEPYDHHFSGFSAESLAYHLQEAGFSNILCQKEGEYLVASARK